MGCSFAVAACCAWIGAGVGASAQTPDCALNTIASARVAAVTDGRSFVLDDGRNVRIAAIDVAPMPRAGEPAGGIASKARAALERLVLGETILLKAAGEETDRYGRLVAHAFRAGSDVPVAATLLEQGQARMSSQGGPKACLTALMRAEAAARRARMGLWADPAFAVRGATDAATLSADRGRLVLVEGKVLSVREGGSLIYMNFARRWSEGFAVTIRKRDEAKFAAAGVAPKSLEGRMVRVRGIIGARSGPRIEASDPMQIEIADVN